MSVLFPVSLVGICIIYSLCEVNNFEHVADVKLIYANDEVM